MVSSAGWARCTRATVLKATYAGMGSAWMFVIRKDLELREERRTAGNENSHRQMRRRI